MPFGRWTLSTGSNTEADETGTRALSDLVAAAHSGIGRFPLLPTDCSARISWSADSDSTQGGFVIPAELAANIAALGIDVYATVSLEEGSKSAD